MTTNQPPDDCIVTLTHGVFTINIDSSCYVQKPWTGDYSDTPAMETFRKVVWDVFKNGQKHGEIQIYCATHHPLSQIEYITNDAGIYSLVHYKRSDLPHTELQRAIFITIVTGFSTDAKTLNELGVKLQKLLNGSVESDAEDNLEYRYRRNDCDKIISVQTKDFTLCLDEENAECRSSRWEIFTSTSRYIGHVVITRNISRDKLGETANYVTGEVSIIPDSERTFKHWIVQCGYEYSNIEDHLEAVIKELYDEFFKQTPKKVRKEHKKTKQVRQEQPKETANQKQSHIDYTIQVVCDSIIPRVFWGSEGFILTYHVIPKEAYGAVPPHYLNNARIRIHRGQDGWTIFAECINGTEIDEGESFKLVGTDSECEDLVEIARIYTVAWNKNFHEQYSNALKYLPHLQYLQHLQQNTQSCSTD